MMIPNSYLEILNGFKVKVNYSTIFINVGAEECLWSGWKGFLLNIHISGIPDVKPPDMCV